MSTQCQKNIASNCPNDISKREKPNLATPNKKIEKKLSVKNVTDALKAGMPKLLSDGGGLYFSITGQNKGIWFMLGRLNGVEKRRVLGHEKMSLAEAREQRDKERKASRQALIIAKKKEKRKKVEEEGRTFGMIADE